MPPASVASPHSFSQEKETNQNEQTANACLRVTQTNPKMTTVNRKPVAVNEAAMVDPSDLSISVMILTFDVDQHGTKPSNLAHNSSPPCLAPLHERMIFVRNRILHGRECAKNRGRRKRCDKRNASSSSATASPDWCSLWLGVPGHGTGEFLCVESYRNGGLRRKATLIIARERKR